MRIHVYVCICRFITEKGGDISAKDKHGWSVLQYAIRYASLETVETLIDMGCDIYHKERKGWTCLHLAARNGQPGKARLLLERGARVNEAQDQGWNALHLAVRYGQPDTISTLLEHGIDINADNRGWTALHLAALNGHTDIASILLNKGAQTDRANQERKTPMDIAREEKHDRIVAIILEREFQTLSNESRDALLPSPPPTPPSAPPLEAANPALNDEESFAEWRRRIQDQLGQVDSDCEDEGDDRDDRGDTLRSKDGRIMWKTLEEETKELMQQLERLRLREVTKIKAVMVRAKDEHNKKLERANKQKAVLSAQVNLK